MTYKAAEKRYSLMKYNRCGKRGDKKVTSALIGASKVSQLEENVRALDNPDFSPEELNQIEKII
ncbi:MAG: hypothetical protein A3J83_06080 [Elusimicrobia bacterium RIFOXYA2_FULL_40_6]|nr:MAG: hypothetical protein A3J83_06080 [Elusimicrobia bacterium RIFOXYA2_FULL_40_6]